MDFRQRIWLAIGVISLTGVAQADTLEVCSSGCTYSSIETAMVAAQSGDIIEIGAGTYYESNLFPTTPNLTFRGATNADGSPAVIIDGQGTADILLAIGAVDASGTTVENIVFTGSSGNALWIYHYGPMIRNCNFTNNVGEWVGTAVWARSDEAVFESCRFTGNDAGLNGTIVNVKGITGFRGENVAGPIFRDCLFENNAANGTVALRWMNASFEQCTFRNNTGTATLDSLSGTSTVLDSLFCENEINEITGHWFDDGGNDFQDVCQSECIGDLNGDLQVDLADFSSFLIQFGQTGADLEADLDQDLDVDLQDFSLFLIRFGEVCDGSRGLR